MKNRIIGIQEEGSMYMCCTISCSICSGKLK